MKFVELFDNDMKPKWDIIENIPQFAALKTTKQSNTWHKEGNALRHTQLVVENMQRELDNLNIDKSSTYYLIMMSAALCHDLGKATTTKWDKEKNDYVCSHHGQAGESITRLLFYEEDIVLRELICYMVRWHMNLHHILDKEEEVKEKLINMAKGWVSIKDMLLLNKCDSLGSKNDIETREYLEDRWETIRKRAEALDIFDVNGYDYKCQELCNKYNEEYYCPPFPSATLHWRTFANVMNDIIDDELAKGYLPNWKDTLEETNKEFTVYMIIGLPGSGKDTIIKEYFKNIPTICRDDIRTEIGIQGEKPMGNKEQENQVTQIFEKRMIEHCKNRQNFIINNTNLRRQYRKRFLEIIKPYEPRVVYIYVEAPTIEDNYNRRDGQIKPEIIKRMALNFDFPLPFEFDQFYLGVQRKEERQEKYGNLIYDKVVYDYLKH